MTLAAQNMQQLTEQLGKTVLYGDVALSPDGTHVAWVQSTAATTSKQTFVRGTTGNEPAAMVNIGATGERTDSGPAWSPDSKTLALFSAPGDNEQKQLWTVSADGSGPIPLNPRSLLYPDSLENASNVGPAASPIITMLHSVVSPGRVDPRPHGGQMPPPGMTVKASSPTLKKRPTGEVTASVDSLTGPGWRTDPGSRPRPSRRPGPERKNHRTATLRRRIGGYALP